MKNRIPVRCIAYLRVSTEKQADKGLSLAAQREKVQAFASLYDCAIGCVVEDAGASGSTLDRPGLRRALAMIDRDEADALLVVKLDRLTRSVRDLGDLMDGYFGNGKCALLSVSEQIDTRTAGGRLVLNVLMSVAQWEREATSERTSAVMEHKAARGEYLGGRVPFGFLLSKDGRSLVPYEGEQAVIRAARIARDEGLSLRAIAAELQRQGFRPREGRGFAPAQVARMVA